MMESDGQDREFYSSVYCLSGCGGGFVGVVREGRKGVKCCLFLFWAGWKGFGDGIGRDGRGEWI